MAHHQSEFPRFCHPVSIKLLLAVFAALIVLTILTVVVSLNWSYSELPKDLAFPVAMLIATAKAFLVCAFFMHMWWDKSINIFAFLGSFFFVALFIALTMLDTSHYQNDIDAFPSPFLEESQR